MITIQASDILIPPETTAGLQKAAIQTILGNIAESARSKWIMLASKDSSSFRFDYIRGIQKVRMKPGQAIITLTGELPHLLENGSPQTDMRSFLLGPDVPIVPVGERGKHKNKKGGYYRAIPFRHTTPNTSAAIGRALGSAYANHDAVSDAKKLGRAVYRAAKALKPTTSNPYKKTTWGERLDTSKLQIPLLKEHHKTDIYAGMVRQEKTYSSVTNERATQSQYVTFRTISTSVTTGWIRQKIEPRNYAQQVDKFVQKIAPQAFSAFVEAQK